MIKLLKYFHLCIMFFEQILREFVYFPWRFQKIDVSNNHRKNMNFKKIMKINGENLIDFLVGIEAIWYFLIIKNIDYWRKLNFQKLCIPKICWCNFVSPIFVVYSTPRLTISMILWKFRWLFVWKMLVQIFALSQ